ncbi:hypothetical protein PR202_ga28558 [Eleusine coracana subsp. coracana]|uniref:NB-ARC domain-containing protein n=1 Tax=Eleusine coracana subsp. coracana TaxID=191504 RepID=A0AAV5DJJ9_ELECO|nr:hypothetical protein PR202_ga28558 [Eleusine coracana subsp. coracana]
MEIVLSAVLSELTTRSINFFINRISKPTTVDVEDHLHRILHRAQVIVDEAMGRRITNHAMLKQLDMIRDAMHRGYYMLDMFKCQSLDKGEPKDQALGDLSSMVIDMKEALIFLARYPLLYRQPYRMHLLLENCMFGRQREAELVINFLLHTQLHGAKELEVLPIVGPTEVGKSTLVAHVCKDERVRDHFSKIWFLRDHDFTDDELATFTEGFALKHQDCVNLEKDGRLLIVVDLDRDLNEEAWNKLYLAYKRCVPSSSKMIVVNQSDKITKLGTVEALTLNYMSYEAYWYFFKTLTFGSTDPKMHPRLAYLAMEIARTVKGSLIRASVFACMLRENFDIHFWYKVLTFLRASIQKHVSRCDEVPKINLQDVIYGNVRPYGKFEALAWRSSIPPYHSYVFTCEIGELKTTGAKRKRSMKNEVTVH